LQAASPGDTPLVDEPEREPVEATDKAVPPETVRERDRLGRELGLLWLGVFAVAAILIALVAWYFA
jgi:hypothetical protein